MEVETAVLPMRRGHSTGGASLGPSPRTPGVKDLYVATPVGPEVHAGVRFTPPGRVTGRHCSPVGGSGEGRIWGYLWASSCAACGPRE